MKKYIIIFILCFVSKVISAQTIPSNTENFIYTKDCLNNDCTNKAEEIQYFDGLGKAMQVVGVKISPTGKDVVIHSEYDQYGRKTKDFLPIPQAGTQNGALYSAPLTNAASNYGSEKIFSEVILEDSPLNRAKQRTQVGNDWTSKPINYVYNVNANLDRVKRFTGTTTWDNGTTKTILGQNAFYPPNYLFRNTVQDEDGNITTEFKNGQGLVVLARKYNKSNEFADTYYVYNTYNQVAYIIPPLASAKSDIATNVQRQEELCYIYHYDGKKRLVEKKLPGKGWEEIVYNKQGKIVLYRDANLKNGLANSIPAEAWVFTKYDQFGRVAYTGISLDATPRKNIQTYIDNQAASISYETRGGGSVTLSTITIDYSNKSYPTVLAKLLGVNYYDTYPLGTPSATPTILGQQILTDNLLSPTNTKSLLTASFLKNIEDDNWTKDYFWYDGKTRLIGNHSVNYLGGYTKMESKLNFIGAPEQVKTYHKRINADTETIINETFEYDNSGRLLAHKHQIDNNPIEILSQNSYNELSQIESKKVGGTNAASPLQVVDYKYNIRGWMTKINDPVNLNGKLFGYEIKYNNPSNEVVAPKKYNGNIAEIDWKTSNDQVLRRYGYQYDKLERLTKATFQEPNTSLPENGYYNEDLTYDINGNILNLNRFQKPESGTTPLQIDQLSYTYSGNTLIRVFDVKGNDEGFRDDVAPGNDDTSDDYAYDLNGNMTRDDNKRITSIKYNLLNLPIEVQLSDNNKINYVYRADGSKLKKIRKIVGSGSSSYETTDYLDGFQYQQISNSSTITPAKLLFFQTAEGYYNKNVNTNPSDPVVSAYVYQYKDQVGNVRLNYYKNNSSNSLVVDNENNYYPFGLLHKKYNTQPGNINYQYKFQDQELQNETGWYSFKWRNYDPTIGRFFNSDPLSEKYAYQSHYNFSENRVVDAVELEGMEAIVNSKTGDIVININGQGSFGLSAGEYTVGVDGEINIAEINLGTYTAKSSLNFSPSQLANAPTMQPMPEISASVGSAVQSIRNSSPMKGYGTSRGLNILAKGIQDQLLDAGNFVRNQLFDKRDYSGLGPRMTGWDGTPMGAEESMDASFNAILFFGSFTTGGLSAELNATKAGLTDLQIVQKAAMKAENAIGGTGRFAGTAKHTFSTNLITRYQSIYGDRGLRTNFYFNKSAGRGFLDVVNHNTATIYDFKFGNAKMSTKQFTKYSNAFEGYSIQIVRP
ncbi:DUF6443 domain-containing protein [Chryseobacterium paludis]|uniref:DUF6443 domain-containing protein n=1 Tax=Chryseobacterium paludis TaxID=2956784 RepID=UPI0021C0F480|nr:DUF6443 domain-containing protein [Chryseobacterium paludis]